MMKRTILALLVAIPVAGIAQTSEPLGVTGKLRFHAESSFGPLGIAGIAATAEANQLFDTPREWGQGGAGYGKRFASRSLGRESTALWRSAWIRRCARIPAIIVRRRTGLWRRRDTRCAEPSSREPTRAARRCPPGASEARTARPFCPNQWYPDRLNTVRLGFIQGSLTLGFDLVGNLGSEFWPDIKRKVLRRK